MRATSRNLRTWGACEGSRRSGLRQYHPLPRSRAHRRLQRRRHREALDLARPTMKSISRGARVELHADVAPTEVQPTHCCDKTFGRGFIRGNSGVQTDLAQRPNRFRPSRNLACGAKFSAFRHDNSPTTQLFRHLGSLRLNHPCRDLVKTTRPCRACPPSPSHLAAARALQ